jgi:hypothetical protein
MVNDLPVTQNLSCARLVFDYCVDVMNGDRLSSSSLLAVWGEHWWKAAK